MIESTVPYLNSLKEFISSYGLLGMAGTILASYFAARFGASESKRQFEEQQEVEKLSAGAQLLQELAEFQEAARGLHDDISNYWSSNGHIGEPHISFGDLKVSSHWHKLSAALGIDVATNVILLMETLSKAKSQVDFLWQVESAETTAIAVSEWCSVLVVDADDAMRKVCEVSKIAIVMDETDKIKEFREQAKKIREENKDYLNFQDRRLSN